MNISFRKIRLSFCTSFLCCLSCLALAGCDMPWEANDTPTYTAASDFFWARDKDKNYGNRTFELETGKSAYMLLKVKVLSTGSNQDEIGVTLTIPYIQDIVSQYRKGQPITPEIDELNHTTTYNFTVLASQNPLDTELTFEFVPVAAVDVTMTLVFDEKIHSTYDKQTTISFVNPKSDGSESKEDVL